MVRGTRVNVRGMDEVLGWRSSRDAPAAVLTAEEASAYVSASGG